MVKKDYIEIKAKKELNPEIAPLLVRVGVGTVFVLMGTTKLLAILANGNTAGIAVMLTKIGFAPAMLWTWLLTLTEIIFGAAVLLGLKPKYTTIPLIIVLIIAIITVSKSNISGLVKDLSILTGLASLLFSGSGVLSLDHYLGNK